MQKTDINIIEEIDVDKQIQSCLDLDALKSFFLFAGAGSGKTRSLVKALIYLNEKYNRIFSLKHQKIGVITYTNAACDEIKQRIEFNPLFEISTIHSFAWALINNFHSDIKIWLEQNLKSEIGELIVLQAKGRSNSKASVDRSNSILAKEQRLLRLSNVFKFTYNPNGENVGYDALNHSEVIKITADFLTRKMLMQTILKDKYPILLIDESQDTNKNLIEAFLSVEQTHQDKFLLGLFGDTMQRIYADGKIDLDKNLPERWAKPAKKINYRSPQRIVKLINKIRQDVDDQIQEPDKKEEGYARFFILKNSTLNKPAQERKIAMKMAIICQDVLWNEPELNVKGLVLEHHMAAKRLGFLEMYEPLYKVDKFRTGLLDGSLPGIRLFTQILLPILKAHQIKDDFGIASIVRKYSPLISKAVLKNPEIDQIEQLRKTKTAIDNLLLLWKDNQEPLFIDVLNLVSDTELFTIPESLLPIVRRNKKEQQIVKKDLSNNQEDDDVGVEELDAWDKFLNTSFKQIEPYFSYINGTSQFDTHQGVKGREFPRVMVIIDDSEARGFSFNFEKLFGAAEKTKADFERETMGDDSSFTRTRRLFYVTCSRTEQSLALIAYSEKPEQVKNNVIAQGWFYQQEVEIVPDL